MPDRVLEAGAELAGLRIERLLGRGGMGAVYEATQVSLERRVALKVIAPDLSADDEFRERFRREARAAAAIEHPHLLPVYEAGELPGGELFLAMRYVNGGDLESRLRALGRIESSDVLTIFGQLAEALDAAHGAGFVHRDVKPANVLLDERSGALRAYLADFGLAKRPETGTRMTETGRLLGSVDYMAPEQVADSELDARVDVYAFGGTLYRALTGEVPYPGENPAAKLIAHRDAPVPLPGELVAGLDPAFDRAVAWAMRKDRNERASSAGEVIRQLATELHDGGAGPDAGGSTAATVAGPTEALPGAARVQPGAGTAVRQTAVLVAVFALIFVAAYLVGTSL